MTVKPIAIKEISENCSLLLRLTDYEPNESENEIMVNARLYITNRESDGGDWTTSFINCGFLIQWLKKLRYVWVLTELDNEAYREKFVGDEVQYTKVESLRGSIDNHDYLQMVFNDMVESIVRKVEGVPKYRNLEVDTRNRRKNVIV